MGVGTFGKRLWLYVSTTAEKRQRIDMHGCVLKRQEEVETEKRTTGRDKQAITEAKHKSNNNDPATTRLSTGLLVAFIIAVHACTNHPLITLHHHQFHHEWCAANSASILALTSSQLVTRVTSGCSDDAGGALSLEGGGWFHG